MEIAETYRGGEVTPHPESDCYENRLLGHTEGMRREVAIPKATPFAAMLDELADAVREGRAPATPGEEGLRDVRILEALYRAADSQTAVRLGDP